jgi:hypothetical protein
MKSLALADKDLSTFPPNWGYPLDVGWWTLMLWGPTSE